MNAPVAQSIPALQAHAAVPARQGHHHLPENLLRRRARRDHHGPRDAGGLARGAARALRSRVHGHQSSAAPGASGLAQIHRRGPGGLRQRQVRRLRFPQERQHRGRRRAADVPGHRHRDHHGQEGPARLHRRRRRGRARRGRARRLPEKEPALFAARAALHVRGEEHRQQHAGAGRDLRRGPGRRRRLQVPVHRQGRRLGQQGVPVPGDAVDPDARPHAGVPEGEGAHARHRGVPALSPRDRHRRHQRRADDEDREARLDQISRQPADARHRGRPRLPRSRDGAGGPEDDAVARRRRAVRRQIFLPRRARDPAAAPRRVAADRARRVVLGRPPGAGQDHPRRRVPRGAGAQSGEVSAGGRHRASSAARW